MRKLVLFMHTSLDGCVAGPNGELDWIPYDRELEIYAEGIVNTVGSPMYGRVTYEMMKSYWPTVLKDSSASKHDMDHAQWLENVEKIVFSKTLKKADWNNTRVISGNIAEEVSRLKKQQGKPVVIFGSPTLAHTCMGLDLIDEYQLTVSPVILGSGKALFKEIKNRTNLKLINAKTFNSGVVGFHYERKPHN